MSDPLDTTSPANGLTQFWITPNWPAPANVKAFTTTRQGGRSLPPWDGLNLAQHVGDNAEAVAHNRILLSQTAKLPTAPGWLNQVHGTTVVSTAALIAGETEADGVVSDEPEKVCAILTADCLPVLLCDRSGTRVAAAHAGWRGLAAGILEATISALGAPENELLAWLGPAISARHFEVGEEVREVFVKQDGRAADALSLAREGHWWADLYGLARLRLAALGVRDVYGGNLCTYHDARRFYSFRRDAITGRMASVIWLSKSGFLPRTAFTSR
ncbi:MAG: peptidoglycan editing factor PgeF [Gammaproteobacteria bacterium]